MCPKGPLVLALILTTVLNAPHGGAAEPAAIAPSTPQPVAEPLIDRIDRYHEAASSYIVEVGEGMDGWLARQFRDPSARSARKKALLVPPEESEGSQMTLSPFLFYRDGEDLKFGLQARGKLRLPRFSERLELVFDSDSDDTSLTPEASRAGDLGLRRHDDNSAASLRYRLPEDWKFKPSLEAGLKFKPEPVPRLGLRLRLQQRCAPLCRRLTQSFFWDRSDGLGSRSTLEVEQFKPDQYMRRVSASALWTESRNGFEGVISAQGFKFLNGRRAIGVKASVSGPLGSSGRVDLYSSHLVWRSRLHRDWAFLEIEPGVDWPRERDFDAVPLIRVKLDLIIGDFIVGPNGNGAR